MRLFLLLGASFLLTVPVRAEVAFDTFSSSGNEADPSWSHAGAASGIGAWIVNVGAQLSSTMPATVTCGGETLSQVGPTVTKSSGEAQGQNAYFLLGSGTIPQGTQTCSVDLGGDVGSASAVTVTAADDVEVVDQESLVSDSVADPSVTLALTGRASFAYETFGSGQNAVSGITPLTDWTVQAEIDNGTTTSGIYTYDIVGTADVTAGLTQTAEDILLYAIAVSEVEAAACASRIALLGVGCQ